MYKTAIVTISDKGSRGEREDITGKELKKMVDTHKDYKTVLETIIPDEEFIIVNKLKEIADMEDVDLYLQTLGVHARRNVDDHSVLQGEQLIYQAKCHLSNVTT